MAAERANPTDSGVLFTAQGGAFPLSLRLPRRALHTRYQILACNLPFLGLNRQPPTALPAAAHRPVSFGAMPWNASEFAVWITGRAPSHGARLPAAQNFDRRSDRSVAHTTRQTLPSAAAPPPASHETHLQLLALLSPVMYRVVQRQMQASGGRGDIRGILPAHTRFFSPQINLTHFELIRQMRLGGATVRQLLTQNLWGMMPATSLSRAVDDGRLIQPDLSLAFDAAQGENQQPAAPGERIRAASQRGVAPTIPQRAGSVELDRSARQAQLVWRAMAPAEQGMAQRGDGLPFAGGQQKSAVDNKRGSGQAPGPYTAPPISQLFTLQESVTQSVKRQIIVEVERQRMEMERELSRQPRNAQSRGAIHAASTPTAIVSDDLVQTLLQKMRSLLQEERFRQGYIR